MSTRPAREWPCLSFLPPTTITNIAQPPPSVTMDALAAYGSDSDESSASEAPPSPKRPKKESKGADLHTKPPPAPSTSLLPTPSTGDTSLVTWPKDYLTAKQTNHPLPTLATASKAVQLAEQYGSYAEYLTTQTAVEFYNPHQLASVAESLSIKQPLGSQLVQDEFEEWEGVDRLTQLELQARTSRQQYYQQQDVSATTQEQLQLAMQQHAPR